MAGRKNMDIRIIAAAAATAAILAFPFAPALAATPCENGDAGCLPILQKEAAQQQENPAKLDNFIQTWKPVSGTKSAKRSKKSRKPAVQQAITKPPAKETAAAAKPVDEFPAEPEQRTETDGVAVPALKEVKEIDAAAHLDAGVNQVQVVAFNEVNEIDLAAPAPPPVPAETIGQTVSRGPVPADNSWIGKLLLAAAGTIALAGATRMLVA
jgi:hypothetical protein